MPWLERTLGGFVLIGIGLVTMITPSSGLTGEPAYEKVDSPVPSAQRGYELLTTKAFVPAIWSRSAYDDAWKQWGLKEKPSDFDFAVRTRYGLHQAPYPNDGLPMGLRSTTMLGITKGVTADCMMCHGGSIFGKSYVGLGNASLEMEGLFTELAGLRSDRNELRPILFPFTNVRGTTEAGPFAVYLLGYRTDDLALTPLYRDLGLHDDSCEDTPAWWLLKKKKTMYHLGATDARSVRSLMQFMMHPLTTPSEFKKAEPQFRDIQKYLLSLDAPKYPFAIDAKKAEAGQKLFGANCAKCHGTYGDASTYPDRIVSLDDIGTDRKKFESLEPKFAKAYSASWFAKESTGSWFFPRYPMRETEGYQAPPLDGIWATAPYFHNGCAPTLDGVLNSSARPKVFTRSYRTDEAEYDQDKVGWKVTEVPAPKASAEAIERRKVYDTSKPGRSNGGHIYGDKLTAEQRAAVIEYLKTL